MRHAAIDTAGARTGRANYAESAGRWEECENKGFTQRPTPATVTHESQTEMRVSRSMGGGGGGGHTAKSRDHRTHTMTN